MHIRLLVDGMESWIDMEGNPYFYGLSSHENVEIKLYNKANPLKPWKMMGRMHDKYLIADGKRYILGGRNTYNYFLGDFPGHKNYDRDVLVVCDEPEKENSVNQLLEYFETIWELLSVMKRLICIECSCLGVENIKNRSILWKRIIVVNGKKY